MLDPARLVFIDETAVSTNMVRLRGRAPRGVRLIGRVPLGQWETITFVAALRHNKMTAPMVVEAQWDRPNVPERARVTACLGPPPRGTKIMASMGSLGHYMQEASASGFAIRDFLHEGNGDIWLAALENPGPFVFSAGYPT